MDLKQGRETLGGDCTKWVWLESNQSREKLMSAPSRQGKGKTGEDCTKCFDRIVDRSKAFSNVRMPSLIEGHFIVTDHMKGVKIQDRGGLHKMVKICFALF